MAITTPSMGLKRWDQPNDVFSYVELSDNFALLDTHDHSSGKGVQIPTTGIVNQAITSTKIANLAVGTTQLADASVTINKLANSAKLGVSQWRPVGRSNFVIPQNSAAATWFGTSGGTAANTGGTVTGTGLQGFLLTPQDYAVAGLTTKYRVKALAMATNVNITTTITFGLQIIQYALGATSTTNYASLLFASAWPGAEVNKNFLAGSIATPVYGPAFTTATAAVTSQNQIDNIDFGGGNTGGTFVLKIDGESTAAITFSSTMSTTLSNMTTALNNLANTAPGDFILTNPSGQFVTIEWTGAYARQHRDYVLQTNSITPTPGAVSAGNQQQPIDMDNLPVMLVVKNAGALPATGPLAVTMELQVKNE